ncbi:MAG TPA: pyrroloquinoline quinone biosynthesis protein PqqE [Solirubrobacterales bacterium]|nr:pyrroloquinoline quinone biosynthesis protein PqqE [Solirubrobacterales bacterium]
MPPVDVPVGNPLLLIAELTYRCPLHCPYCSNPTDIGAERYRDELPGEDWQRVFREAADLGVLQLALTGGEPMARKEIVELARAATAAGLYSTLVTSAMPFPRRRVEALHAAGLDHVQISFQHSDPVAADEIGGTIAFERKVKAAALARELDFPLTVNCVLHRRNIDEVESIIRMAERLGARRLELANTQYHGWALLNRDALMPTRAQLEHGEEVVRRERERLGPKLEILWVLPDYYEEVPKPCMGGWAADAILVQPNGDVLPCQAAASIPGLTPENVRERPLREIWFESELFNAFRGTAWMQEPCLSCPLGRRHEDFGGCRCQALALTGDAAATDPVCKFSPHHGVITAARREEPAPAPAPAGAEAVAAAPPFVYRDLIRS